MNPAGPETTIQNPNREKAGEIPSNDLALSAQRHAAAGRRVVAIQGLGFVGAAVAAVISSARDEGGNPLYFVIGVDLPTEAGRRKAGWINSGRSPITAPDPELNRLIASSVLETGNLNATTSDETYSLADVIIIAVPFDVRDRAEFSPAGIEVDAGGFEACVRSIGRRMRDEALVLVETTVPAGSCERLIAPVLREERRRRGLTGPLFLAHAYERVMPGPNYVNSIRHFWRSFSGIDDASAAKAEEFLATYIETKDYPLRKLDRTEASEMAKLLENSYRAVNIAFIHEWALMAEQLGVNLFDVVDSIRVRRGTHDNMRYPGFGVGGYCLTKDSLLAQWALTNLFGSGHVLDISLHALRVNHGMPLHALDLLSEMTGGALGGKKIVVCGISYLPDVADARHSPAEIFVDALLKRGAVVSAHDPCLESWPERPEIQLTRDLSEALIRADGIVFAVPHEAYLNLEAEAIINADSGLPCIVDAQNIILDGKARILHDRGCRLAGVGKGHWRRLKYQDAAQ